MDCEAVVAAVIIFGLFMDKPLELRQIGRASQVLILRPRELVTTFWLLANEAEVLLGWDNRRRLSLLVTDAFG